MLNINRSEQNIKESELIITLGMSENKNPSTAAAMCLGVFLNKPQLYSPFVL